jgi:hypothetical protein
MPEFNASEYGQQERLRRLYIFLLSRTDLGDDGDGSQPNESLVAYQWGMEDYRIFVRKVLRSILPERYENSPRKVAVPNIELLKLVEILDSIQEYSSGKRDKYIKRQRKVLRSPRITQQDKLTALKLYSELSEWERNTLELPMDEKSKLTAQLLVCLQSPTIDTSTTLLKKLYSEAIENNLSVSSQSNENNDRDIDAEIRMTIEKLLKNYHNFSNEDLKSEVDRHKEKVTRELYRITFQSGLQLLTEIPDSNIQLTDIVSRLSDELVSRLVCSIVENELLTQEFPVFIKWIDVERVRPMPLRIYRKEVPDGLLSSSLVNPSDGVGISGLESQTAYKVTVYFRMADKDFSSQENPESKFLEFSEEITGIGSPVSLATVAINRILLWDISCLREKDIFPTAKQVLVHEKVLEDNPHKAVWCHTVVQLHTHKAIEDFIESKEIGHGLDIFNEQSHGDYCGFDVLEVILKSGFHARLRAIKKLGVNPERYLKDLKKKVLESMILKQAKSYLRFYPFSFCAMEGFLEQYLFKQEGKDFYRNKNKSTSIEFTEAEGYENKNWSLFAYDAHLTLAETLLTEGKQEAAKCYLKDINIHIARHEPKCILSDLMKARYHYLMARYHYLYDLMNKDRIHSDRSNAILALRIELEEAKLCLQHRVRMCEAIEELSQSNNHPYFSLLGKINFLEARLYLGFCSYLNISYPENIKQVLMHLQTARICAARDGSADEYAYYSSFQSWIYSMLAYSEEVKFMKALELSKDECIDWSKRLIHHAIICYGNTGTKIYDQIKFHAGDAKPKRFGDIIIPEPPFIKEDQGNIVLVKKEEDQGDTAMANEEDTKVINIPYFSLFEYPERNHISDEGPEIVRFSSNPPTEVVLFGTQSSILLFASGMNKLCVLEEKENDLENDLEIIFQYLLAAYATAKDGAHGPKEITSNEPRKLERLSNSNIAKLYPIAQVRGLYLHRIGYVVPLSALALYSCGVIRLIYKHCSHSTSGSGNQESVDIKEEIKIFSRIGEYLIDDIHEKTECREHSFTLAGTNQERFNGYMDSHLARVEEYYKKVIDDLKLTDEQCATDKDSEYLSRWQDPQNHCLKWRDKLMKNLLRLIVGIGPDIMS